MAKILIFLASLLPLTLFAITAEEEALILNQEIDYLESSAKNLEVNTQTASVGSAKKQETISDKSLEDIYFGGAEKDEINVRSAAPKRRSF